MVTAQAVKELRSHFNEAQQAFSNRMGMSMASICHYETGARIPDAISLRKLYLQAVDVCRLDCAQVFGKAMASELNEPDFYDVRIESESEFHVIRALQLVLKDERFRAQRKKIVKALAPAQKELQRAAAVARIPAAEIPVVSRRMIAEQQRSESLWPAGWVHPNEKKGAK